MPSNDKVLVIGGGVVGIACAHYLNESGFDVTVIDRSAIAGACSNGNLGYICPSHILPLTEPGAVGVALRSIFQRDAPFRVKPRASFEFINWMWQFARRCNERQMCLAATHLKAILDSSINEYRRIIAKDLVDCEWRDSGLLHVMKTDVGMRDYAENDKLLADQFGVLAQRIDGTDLPDFDPAFKPGLAGAFYYEGDAFARPDLLVTRWAETLESKGVGFVENCEFESLEKANGVVTGVNTSHGMLPADQFVFAVGAWSAKLASDLGCSIPVEPGKGYSITMRRPEICPNYPMLFPEHNVGVTPFEDSYRLGSMMEFVGFDTSIPPRRIQQLKDSTRPYLVEPYTDETIDTWYGWRPMTWDSLPIIGRVPDIDNAFLATGHNMLGVSMAAATGKLIAELMVNRSTHIDAVPFSAERFYA